MSIRKSNNKEINVERIIEVESYLYSLYVLVNPNTREITKRNVIGVDVAVQTLRLLQAELKQYSIGLEEINLEEIYVKENQSAVNAFIKKIQNESLCGSYEKMYREILQAERLEEIYPTTERIKRVQELEVEIGKKRKIVDSIKEFNPSLAKTREMEIQGLEQELESINETFIFPTREELVNRLYLIAVGKLEALNEQCKDNLEYLEGVCC